MPATSSCTPTCGTTALTTEVPGPAGQSAYTTTDEAIVIPGAAGAAGTIDVGNSDWIAVGQILFISDDTNYGHFEVTSIPDSVQVAISWLDYNGDNGAGLTIAIGAKVTSAGPTLATPVSVANGGTASATTSAARSSLLDAALDAEAVLTDNSTGTASDTIAAGVGCFTLPIFIDLDKITAAGEVLTDYLLGFRFKILTVDFRVHDPVTTAAKLATLVVDIGAAPTTGGAVLLTSANCTPVGQPVAGTAVTGAQTGSAIATLTVRAERVTAFQEGSGWLLIKVQNMDTADAIASLAAKQNTVLTALKP